MSVAPSLSVHSRSLRLTGLAMMVAALWPAVAWADCGADLGALMSKRTASIGILNQNTKAHGGKLDPVTACPQLRSLAAIEGTVLAYMNKNKDWCSIPEDLVGKMTESRAKSANFAAKACDFAAKMKKMQTQQAQGAAAAAEQQQAIKLPTGPL